MSDRLRSITSGGWNKLRFTIAGAIVVVALAIWGIPFASSNLPSFGSGSEQSSAASGSGQVAMQASGELLVIRKSAEEVLHIPDDQESLELPLVVGQNTVKVVLPANATDAEIETLPMDKPYIMCFEEKGCFVSNPGEHWNADIDFDTAVFWFQGVEPGVTMVITPIGR